MNKLFYTGVKPNGLTVKTKPGQTHYKYANVFLTTTAFVELATAVPGLILCLDWYRLTCEKDTIITGGGIYQLTLFWGFVTTITIESFYISGSVAPINKGLLYDSGIIRFPNGLNAFVANNYDATGLNMQVLTTTVSSGGLNFEYGYHYEKMPI